MKLIAHALVLVVLSTVSTSAFALFSGELLVGKRWYEIESGDEKSGVDGQVIHVGAHLDPIPAVPVAFGLGVDTITLDTNDYYPADIDNAAIFEVGLEVKAWVPLVPIFTPYAKINYPIMATYVTKGESGGSDFASKGDLSGYHLHIGAEMGLLPLMSVMFEVGMGSQDLEITEIESGGTKSEVSESNPANSQSFLFGLKVGI